MVSHTPHHVIVQITQVLPHLLLFYNTNVIYFL